MIKQTTTDTLSYLRAAVVDRYTGNDSCFTDEYARSATMHVPVLGGTSNGRCGYPAHLRLRLAARRRPRCDAMQAAGVSSSCSNLNFETLEWLEVDDCAIAAEGLRLDHG